MTEGRALWLERLFINAIGLVVTTTDLANQRVDQVVVLERPRELRPFVAALVSLPVNLVTEQVGEAGIAARPELLAHAEQQKPAVARAPDLESPEQLEQPER